MIFNLDLLGFRSTSEQVHQLAVITPHALVVVTALSDPDSLHNLSSRTRINKTNYSKSVITVHSARNKNMTWHVGVMWCDVPV